MFLLLPALFLVENVGNKYFQLIVPESPTKDYWSSIYSPKNREGYIFPQKKGEVGKIVKKGCQGRVTYACC